MRGCLWCVRVGGPPGDMRPQQRQEPLKPHVDVEEQAVGFYCGKPSLSHLASEMAGQILNSITMTPSALKRVKRSRPLWSGNLTRHPDSTEHGQPRGPWKDHLCWSLPTKSPAPS